MRIDLTAEEVAILQASLKHSHGRFIGKMGAKQASARNLEAQAEHVEQLEKQHNLEPKLGATYRLRVPEYLRQAAEDQQTADAIKALMGRLVEEATCADPTD